MECRICPKKDRCSGVACYYDYYPERKPDLDDYEQRELLEDKARLASLEGDARYGS